MNPNVINRFTCSTAIACALVVAAPSSTPANAAWYRLSHNSTYMFGCFELCACPLAWFNSVSGRFRLLPVSLTGTYDVYAVTQLNIAVGTNTPPTTTIYHITGQGTYTVFSEVAVLNRMELDLVTNGGAPVHFDSGWVAAGAAWPNINVTVAENGAPACWDTRIGIDAKRLHADITDDGEVNVDDLLAVITNWGECPPLPDACIADIAPTPGGDRTVNIDDLLAVIYDW